MKKKGYDIFREGKSVSLRKETRKKKKGLRILSAGLTMSMLLSGCGPASVAPVAVQDGVEQVGAALQEGNNAAGRADTVITGFGSLSEDVREQTVFLGTTIEELILPDTLEAYVMGNDAGNEGGGGKASRRFGRRQGRRG